VRITDVCVTLAVSDKDWDLFASRW